MNITEEDVFIYREIYYEHFKPALRKMRGRFGMSKEEGEKVLKPALEKYGWSYEKYQAFSTIDLLQRLARTKSEHFLKTGQDDRVNIKLGDEDADLLSASNLPELKCPRRTEEGKWKRVFNLQRIREERIKNETAI